MSGMGQIVSKEDGGEISENVVSTVDCAKIIPALRSGKGPTYNDATSVFQISKHTYTGNPDFDEYIKKRRKLLYDSATAKNYNKEITISSGEIREEAYDAEVPIAHGGKRTATELGGWGLPVVPQECQDKWGKRDEGKAIVKYAKETLFQEDYVEGLIGYERTFSPFKKLIDQKCDVILETEMSTGAALDETTKNKLGLVGGTRQMGSGLCTAGNPDCIRKEVERYLQNCHIAEQTACSGDDCEVEENESDPPLVFNLDGFADTTIKCTDNLTVFFTTGEKTYDGVPEGAPKIPDSLLDNGELVSIEKYYTCAGLDNELSENCHRTYLGLQATVQGTSGSSMQNFEDKDDAFKGALEGMNEESAGVGDAESSEESDDEAAEEKQQTVLAIGAFVIGLAVVYSL